MTLTAYAPAATPIRRMLGALGSRMPSRMPESIHRCSGALRASMPVKCQCPRCIGASMNASEPLFQRFPMGEADAGSHRFVELIRMATGNPKKNNAAPESSKAHVATVLFVPLSALSFTRVTSYCSWLILTVAISVVSPLMLILQNSKNINSIRAAKAFMKPYTIRPATVEQWSFPDPGGDAGN